MLYRKILYHSIYGYFTILSDEHYIRKIEFGKQRPSDDVVWQEDHPLLQQAACQMIEYFDGKRKAFALPFKRTLSFRILLNTLRPRIPRTR